MARLKVLRFRLPRHDLHIAKPLPLAKRTDPFYSKPEFRVWRKVVVDRANRRCEFVEADGAVCGVSDPRMYADHVVEVRDGGAQFDPSNGMCLCARHHTIKTIRVKRERESFAAEYAPRGGDRK